MAIGPALATTSLVLDNDIFSAWRYGRDPRVQDGIADHQIKLKSFPALTSITVYQALYGFENKSIKPGEPSEQTKQGHNNTKRLIASCLVLSFDQRAAEIAAYTVPRLAKNMSKEFLLDVLIAATALAHGYGVATRNKKDFELIATQIPDNLILQLANW